MTDVRLVRPDAVLRGTAVGAGPTVLLLHAGGEQKAVWEPVAEVLATAGFRAVAYDLRGHGDSSGTAATLSDLADDVSAMIRRERAPVALVGASLGGFAAVGALTVPSTAARAAGLVLVDVVPDPDPRTVRAWLDQRGLRRGRAELVEDILGRGSQLLAGVTALRLPVLLVRGGPGSAVTDDDVTRLRRAKPGVEVIVVPSAGHLVAHDAPVELGTALVDTLTRWLVRSRRTT